MKKFNFKYKFSRLLYNKTFVISLSLISAFAIWLIIMINQNPTRERVFSNVPLTLSTENTAAGEMGLGIVSNFSNQKFVVTVSGPNYIVSSLKNDDFTLSADISNINSAGTYSLDVIGNRNSAKTDYTFVSISPSKIDVTFDYIDSKEFTVVPKLVGVSATEGLIAENPFVTNSEQSTITIKGPRTVMEKIATVGSLAEVNKTLSSTQTFESGIVLYDENDKVLYRYSDGKIFDSSNNEILDNNLSLNFVSVKVTQPISKKKTVSVVPVFENLPSGLTVENFEIKVNYENVTVIGTPDVVDGMSTLSLSPIDFKTVSSQNNSFEISPNLPEGVKLFDNIEMFTVQINMLNYTEKVISVTDIRFKDVAEGLNPRKNSSIKNVKICGNKEVISLITSNDFYAEISLKEMATGNHTVDAVIKSEKFNTVWAVGNYTASITIE